MTSQYVPTESLGQEPIHEYTWLKARDFEEEEWEELKRYKDFLVKCCGDEYDLEERPQLRIEENEEQINFGGFVGTYRFVSTNRQPLSIEPDPQKLSKKEFERILQDVSRWATMLGPPLSKDFAQLLFAS